MEPKTAGSLEFFVPIGSWDFHGQLEMNGNWWNGIITILPRAPIGGGSLGFTFPNRHWLRATLAYLMHKSRDEVELVASQWEGEGEEDQQRTELQLI